MEIFSPLISLLQAQIIKHPPGPTAIERVDAIGNVHVSVPNAIIRGDKGEYYPKTSQATLTGNVKITSNKNQLNGDTAKVNLKTGIYRLIGKRVKGLITPDQKR